MVWFFAFILLIVVVMLLIKRKAFYGVVFSMSLLGIATLLLVTILSAVKFATVAQNSGIEHRIYVLLRQIKLNYFDLKRIANLGTWLFAVSMLMVAWKNPVWNGRRRRRVAFGGLFALISVWLLGFDSVKMQDIMHINAYLGKSWAGVMSSVIQMGEITLLFLCCAIPLWELIAIVFRTRIKFRRRYLTTILIFVCILSTIFLCIVCTVPVCKYLWDYEPDRLSSLYGFYKGSMWQSHFLWLFLLVVLLVMIVCLLYFDVLKEPFFRHRKARDMTQIALNDLRHVFHSYKNALFSIECLCETALTHQGEAEGEVAIQKAAACARSYRGQISKFLDIYNRENSRWERFRLEDAIREAWKRVGEMEKIAFSLRLDTNHSFLYGDQNEVMEAFVNLFLNARDAIQKKADGGGSIVVVIWSENAMVCVSVWDNGSGMSKETLKNLYMPFYTTKKTAHNWGIGLAQVRRTVEAHQGIIDVESRLGQYTEFQIAFPMDE